MPGFCQFDPGREHALERKEIETDKDMKQLEGHGHGDQIKPSARRRLTLTEKAVGRNSIQVCNVI